MSARRLSLLCITAGLLVVFVLGRPGPVAWACRGTGCPCRFGWPDPATSGAAPGTSETGPSVKDTAQSLSHQNLTTGGGALGSSGPGPGQTPGGGPAGPGLGAGQPIQQGDQTTQDPALEGSVQGVVSDFVVDSFFDPFFDITGDQDTSTGTGDAGAAGGSADAGPDAGGPTEEERWAQALRDAAEERRLLAQEWRNRAEKSREPTDKYPEGNTLGADFCDKKADECDAVADILDQRAKDVSASTTASDPTPSQGPGSSAPGQDTSSQPGGGTPSTDPGGGFAVIEFEDSGDDKLSPGLDAKSGGGLHSPGADMSVSIAQTRVDDQKKHIVDLELEFLRDTKITPEEQKRLDEEQSKLDDLMQTAEAVQAVRAAIEAARRSRVQNNLTQVGTAMCDWLGAGQSTPVGQGTGAQQGESSQQGDKNGSETKTQGQPGAVGFTAGPQVGFQDTLPDSDPVAHELAHVPQGGAKAAGQPTADDTPKIQQVSSPIVMVFWRTKVKNQLALKLDDANKAASAAANKRVVLTSDDMTKAQKKADKIFSKYLSNLKKRALAAFEEYKKDPTRANRKQAERLFDDYSGLRGAICVSDQERNQVFQEYMTHLKKLRGIAVDDYKKNPTDENRKEARRAVDDYSAMCMACATSDQQRNDIYKEYVSTIKKLGFTN